MTASKAITPSPNGYFGPDSAEGEAWFEKWRHVLRHDPKGAGKVIDALRYLLHKGKGSADIARGLGYFRNNQNRMNYSEVADAGYPIGSCAVEAANKVLVNSRMKRSGQRWGRDGGQGVLTFRSLLRSGRFDRAWAVPARSWQQWMPPTTTWHWHSQHDSLLRPRFPENRAMSESHPCGRLHNRNRRQTVTVSKGTVLRNQVN